MRRKRRRRREGDRRGGIKVETSCGCESFVGCIAVI